MQKYIECDKALESIDLIAENDGEKFDKDSARYAIQTTETADVQEVKHGYWKDTEYGTCSVCDRKISEIYDADSSMSYGILDELTTCPFCGAKMDAKNEK